MSELGRRIKSARLGQGLSLEKLAERAGISKPTLFNIEEGRTTDPQPMTLRKIGTALGCLLAPEGAKSLDSQLPILASVPLHRTLNLTVNRRQAIARFTEQLRDSPPSETCFVDYYNCVEDTSWLRQSGIVHITTIEIDQVWDIPALSVPYEVALVRYKHLGLSVHRLFLLDIRRLQDAMYKVRFQEIMARHVALGLEPRFVTRADMNEVHGALGVTCDSFVVIGTGFAMFSQLSAGPVSPLNGHPEPAMLRTSNRKMCDRASNLFHEHWKAARKFEQIELVWGQLSRESAQIVDREVRAVQSAYEVAYR